MLSDTSYRGNDKDIFKLCHWVQHFCHWQELGRDSPAGLWFLLAAHTQPKVANKTQSKRCLTVDHRLLSCATSSLSPPADSVFSWLWIWHQSGQFSVSFLDSTAWYMGPPPHQVLALIVLFFKLPGQMALRLTSVSQKVKYVYLLIDQE